MQGRDKRRGGTHAHMGSQLKLTVTQVTEVSEEASRNKGGTAEGLNLKGYREPFRSRYLCTALWAFSAPRPPGLVNHLLPLTLN